jgi:hypothetical protein
VSSISNLVVFGGQFLQLPERQVYQNLVLALSGIRPYVQGGTIGSYTYELVNQYVNGTLASVNAGGTGTREVAIVQLIIWEDPNTGVLWSELGPFLTYPSVRGLMEPTGGPWDNRTGQIVYGTDRVNWSAGIQFIIPPEDVNGTPSSAFGFTAPGGTQGNPSPSVGASFVSVNPGQTYTITVGQSGGAVTFQFVQG